jgi:hypothetical protein
MPSIRGKKFNKVAISTKETKLRGGNAYIKFSKEFSDKCCDVGRNKAIGAASTVWNDQMTNGERNLWFRSSHEKKLLKQIRKDLTLLNPSNHELLMSTMFSTDRNPQPLIFIIELESLLAGIKMEKLIKMKNDEEYLKSFKEFINIDMCD